MPADRPNTITIHLNSNDSEWFPEGSAGWDTRFGVGCEDNTRQDSVPLVGELGELPWSPRTTGPPNNFIQPITQMTGVRFEPLDGNNIPNFLVPFYDWGVRAAWFGKAQQEDRLSFGDYFELLFDTPEARQSFIEVFGTDVKMTRTGKDSTDPDNPIIIFEERQYTINRSDSQMESNTTTWGEQTFYMLSWKDAPAEIETNPPTPTIISDTVDLRLVPQVSTIIDIEFINATDVIDIMGTCDTQNINPCDPVAPPECNNDGDCTSCNSKCISGTCICEDCPCNSVCLDVDMAGVPSQTIGVRELIDGDQENCVDCVHPVFGSVFCNCLAAIDGGICRLARDQEDGTNCDCKVGHVCCENFINGVSDSFNCCNAQEFGANGPGNIVQRCIDGFGCAQSACEVDADCGNECTECSLNENGVGTCTPKDNETSCGTDGLNCTWCQNGECVDNPTTDNCNCPGQECDPGFDCCPGGFCCPSEFGCGEGSGCDQCDSDGDCPPCEECSQIPGGNRCTVTDCDPCFTREEPDCECNIPVCRNCEECTSSGDNHFCVENCPVCSSCDGDGNCSDPPFCPTGTTLNPSTCLCDDNCEDCQIWNGLVCETDETICGCCDTCLPIPGTVFSECTSSNNNNCPNGQFCVDCQCQDPGCPVACTGCLVCDLSQGTGVGFCNTPQNMGLPDPCNGTCQECEFLDFLNGIGQCGNSTCDGDCCDDGSCCSAGNKCCDDFTDNSIYCCVEDEVCCGDGTCCPNGQICCEGSCCDPDACESCVPGVGCVECADTPCGSCVGGSCVGGCPDCKFCQGGDCVPDPTRLCDPTCPFNWCDENNCTPAPSCESECQCSGQSNEPCTCFQGAPLFALMDCICGEDPPEETPGACCSPFGVCSQRTPEDCARIGHTFRGGRCNPNPCSLPGSG